MGQCHHSRGTSAGCENMSTFANSVLRLLLRKPSPKTSRSSDETCAQQHHARRLWNSIGYLTAAQANLSHFLKHCSINPNKTNRCNHFSFKARPQKKVLPLGIEGKVISKKTAGNVD